MTQPHSKADNGEETASLLHDIKQFTNGSLPAQGERFPDQPVFLTACLI